MCVRVCVYERDWQNGDEMESRGRQQVCAGCKLWGMKDAHWMIRRGRLTDRGGCEGDRATERTEALQSWLWHASLSASASHPLSWWANQWAYCCDVCDQRFMGVRVPQCLATIALKLLLLIIKDCRRTLSLCLALHLFFHLLQSQFANGCSNLVIYCCQRYASSKMH